MRSSLSASSGLALAFFLFFTATSIPASVSASHGELKARAEREGYNQLYQGKDRIIRIINPTTTFTYTLKRTGRFPLTRTTSSTSIRATSTKATSTKATSTSTKVATTTTKPVTTSKPATTSTTPKVTTSTPPAAATTTTTPANGLTAYQSGILKAHNDARAPRGANALTWSTEAEAAAKAWGDKCVWQHGGNTGMGQNLAASAGYKQTGQQVVDAWMSEEKDYNPASPNYSHFTQVVWKGTTSVGCYQATCTKLLNPDGSETFAGFSPSYFTVCNYKPPGNVIGQFAANVQKI